MPSIFSQESISRRINAQLTIWSIVSLSMGIHYILECNTNFTPVDMFESIKVPDETRLTESHYYQGQP